MGTRPFGSAPPSIGYRGPDFRLQIATCRSHDLLALTHAFDAQKGERGEKLGFVPGRGLFDLTQQEIEERTRVARLHHPHSVSLTPPAGQAPKLGPFRHGGQRLHTPLVFPIDQVKHQTERSF
ncbi:MAG TPA: hypothetical protein VKM72_00445 [Thermoanaerobaculia bacterium]|nr:hypothetical protein [Thermoanaerobaculia bacterium]